MFEAIRSRLVGAWRDLRSRGLVSLFFFELVVVTLGVLLAQGIADWSTDRKAERRMLASVEELKSRIARTVSLALNEENYLGCVDERAIEISRRLSDGEIDPSLIERPGFVSSLIAPLADEDLLLARGAFGSDAADRFIAYPYHSLRLRNEAGEMIDAWGRLSIGTDVMGTVSSADRAAAKIAAADVRASVKSMRLNYGTILELAQEDGIEPSLPPGRRGARNCEEFWEHGPRVPVGGAGVTN